MKKNINLTRCLFVVAFFVFTTVVMAQQDFNTWLKKEQNKLQEFQDKRDNEFLEFLKKEWVQMQLMQGIVPDNKPKPENIPTTKPTKLPEDLLPEPPVIVTKIPVPKPIPAKPVEMPQPVHPQAKKGVQIVNIDFYNSPLSFRYDKKFEKISLNGKITKEQIAGVWETLSRVNYDDLIDQLVQTGNRMNLNDWGLYMLVKETGTAIYGNDENKVHLLAWFILDKTGYDARIGYDAQRVYLLVPSQNTIYSTPYFEIDGKRYYVISAAGNAHGVRSLSTYKGDYPGASKAIKLFIDKVPSIQSDLLRRNLKFTYENQPFNFTVEIDRNLIYFYKFYPQTNYQVYFDAPFSPQTFHDLYKQFAPVIKGKSQAESVNLLLRFVQKAFRYETDAKQFGREKPFFPDETLYYPFSDCEDRAVLFAHLVHNLLGLSVIGLDYPGHVATAVHFPTEVSGDQVVYNGKKYVICDPTFINANIGECMEKFKTTRPKVIRIL